MSPCCRGVLMLYLPAFQAQHMGCVDGACWKAAVRMLDLARSLESAVPSADPRRTDPLDLLHGQGSNATWACLL
ncbi:hypothetical protein IE81DRAFT_321745 [Ceraceosorus guamensis]|uniref:Secreted protein n=1 Tax=Ceraceosorus guamensis TaxID=1522189 RepID=A0A316W2Z1_9BASI|nr:hypothetical protein IE81DRAFT_321745 [Ceraceosorus guamensis]PWN44082.1 hypothetical protein IE81DRAFT_321745 [Ceraceosorus guamensis]